MMLPTLVNCISVAGGGRIYSTDITNANIRQAEYIDWSAFQFVNEDYPYYLRPISTYHWISDVDNNGNNINTFKEFDKNNPTSNGWQLVSTNTKCDLYGSICETKKTGTNGSSVFESKYYRYDAGLLMATAKNAEFDECAIFTGDYQEFSNTFTRCQILFDKSKYYNWEKGKWNITGIESVCDVDNEGAHFGEKSTHVKNSYGPMTTVSKIDINKDYLFSAWVCPLNPNPMRMVVEVWRKSDQQKICAFDAAVSGLTAEKWQKISKTITSSDLKAKGINSSNDFYFKIWIGNDPKDTKTADFYVEDIRFHPSDALVTTNYYVAYNGYLKPIVTLDENANPGEIIFYDNIGRPREIHKVLLKNGVCVEDKLVKRMEFKTQGSTIFKHKLSKNIVFVNSLATGANNGSDWANAYTSLLIALSNALPYQEIWVAAGTYTTGSKTNSFQLKEGQKLFGGFTGNEKYLYERVVSRNTILQAEGSDYISKNLIIAANFCTIDGFDFRKANVNALKCEGVTSVFVRNCYFDGNQGKIGVEIVGGVEVPAWAPAIKIKNSTDITIVSTHFINNMSQNNGGAVGIDNSTVLFSTCEFTSNSATSYSGAVDILNSTKSDFENCSFSKNYTMGTGGAVSTYKSTITFKTCNFNENTAGEFYGALWIDENSYAYVTSCAFDKNKATTKDGGAIGNQASDLRIFSSTFTSCTCGRNGGAFFSSPNLDQNSRGLKSELIINDSHFTNNKATVTGGAGVAQIGSFCDFGSVYSGNTAPTSPGVYIYDAPCN
jgi:hypothetical protein